MGGPLGSDAVRCVPIRWVSTVGPSSRISYRSRGMAFSILSLAGIGFWPFRTEAPRLMLPDDEVLDFSDSGGGVGGKTLRLIGGSDC